jgi:hypothetical protein
MLKNYLNNINFLILKYFPSGFKKKLGKVYDLGSPHTVIFEKYSSAHSPTCLVFNSGEKRPGTLTVGYDSRNDIRLERMDPIKLNIVDESFDAIEINLFLETIENDNNFWDFFREVGRLIKKDGEIKIFFLDLEVVSNKNNVKEEFLNIKRRFLYSKKASIFNSAISYVKDCRRIIDLETLERVATLSGLKIIKRSYRNKSIIKEVVLTKNMKLVNQWKLTNTLPQEGEIIKDTPIYYFNCDPALILENLLNIDLAKLQGRRFLSVIGSLFFINFIPLLKPKEIILFDINPLQVRYLKLIVQVIRISPNFNKFLENFFSRKFCIDIEEFLSQPKEQKIARRVRKYVTDKEIYDASLGKIAEGRYLKLNSMVPVIKIEGNSMCQHITITDKEYFKPGPRINVINTSWGLARNFNYLKSKLQDAKIIVSKLEDRKLLDSLNTNSILFVSNIGEEDWLNGVESDLTQNELKLLAKKYNIARSFRKQWTESVTGFKKFVNQMTGNFWIIDSAGNIFSKNDLLLERSDSHEWLWSKLKPKIMGKHIEIIHKKKGTWGFKENLETINYKQYLKSKETYDTVVLHILLGNGVSVDAFIRILLKASKTAKRIIIMEHDRDSLNFGNLSDLSIVDIRSLMSIIRSVQLLKGSEMHVEWSGASRRIDRKLFYDAQNYNRNILITLDL